MWQPLPHAQLQHICTMPDSRLLWVPAISVSEKALCRSWHLMLYSNCSCFLLIQEHIQAFTEQLKADGIATRFTHRLDGDKQWQYNQVMQHALPTAALLACDACMWSSAHVLVVLAPFCSCSGGAATAL